MTRNERSKKNIENKIVEIYLRLKKRQTKKPARLANLRKRLEFFKNLLNEMSAAEETKALNETDQSVSSLSTETSRGE